MKTQKILIGTLTAGITMFLLGWLVYGILLKDFMGANCDTSMMRPETEMIWWAMIASNLIWGLLLSLILDWSGNQTPSSGFKTGAVLGLLTGLGFDLSMYSMTTMFLNLGVVIADSLTFALLIGLSGLLAAWAMNKVNKSAV